MTWEALLIGAVVASIAWMLLTFLLLWRTRAAPAPQGRVIERLQSELLQKINELPAEDLEKIREYIHEIKRLQPDSPAAERAAASSERGGAAQTMNLLKALVRSKADDPVRQRLVRYTADPRSARLAARRGLNPFSRSNHPHL